MSKTFKNLCFNWLQKKKIKLKQSSYNKYEYLFNDYIVPELGDLILSDISISTIEKGISNMYYSEDGKEVSNSLMKSILYLINAVLGYGRHLGYFTIGNVIFELPYFYEQNKVPVLEPHQESKLISYLLKYKNDNSLGIMISLFTGMRLGEVCALKYQNVDLENSILYIRSTAQRIKTTNGKNKTELVVTTPKSKKSCREIPIPTFLLNYMKKCLSGGLADEFYILGGGENPYEPRTLQYGFKSILKKCEIEYRNYHSLRHTFATNCIKAGFDVKSLSEILGHANVNFTLNRYVHSDMEQKRIQMEKLMDIYKNTSKIA